MLSPRFAYGLLLLITFSVAQMAHSGWAYAQPSLKKADIERVEKLRAEAAESLLTLSELLAARKEQAGGITKLKLSINSTY